MKNTGKVLIAKVLIFYSVFVFLFLFLPAGSLRYWEGWAYGITLLIPLLITVTYLMRKDPQLLERRFRTKEKERKQKIIVRLFRIPFMLCFLIPGLDYRFHWSEVPVMLVVIGNVLVFAGYMWVFLVFRENTYTSRIVEVEQDQKIISTGPYALVRHPMYLGISVMYLFTPLALGSWWALLVFIFVPVILLFRIFNEEEVLKRELPGYKEYCQKIRYRLIPFLW